MTVVDRLRATFRMPALHWPGIRGRARADAGPLLLVAVVVAAVTVLAGAVPPLIRSTADDATREAIRHAGDEATVRVQAPWPDDYGPTGGRIRTPDLALDVKDLGDLAEEQLDPALRSALLPPVSSVSSISLLVTDGSIQRHFQLEYLRSVNEGPKVTWVAGKEPGQTVDGFPEVPLNGPPWRVQVGLSEAEATALHARPGTVLKLEDDQYNPYNIQVSGIFRPVDSSDPAWRIAPWVLRPVADLDGAGSTRLGGLLSARSLPDARLAFLSEQLRRTVRFSADPDKITWKSAQSLAATVTTQKAESAGSGDGSDALQWETQLDNVLREVGRQISAASAQASVLLVAILATAVFVLLLTADLLARRREQALVITRQRGTSLPVIAAELLIESVVVTVSAAALGVLAARLIAGDVDLGWVVPVVVGAVAAVPVAGTITAARATRSRRAPANRSARRWSERIVRLRRAAIDAAVVLAAVGALVALRQRGLGAGTDSDAALPAGAPTLGVIAAAVLVARLMPVVLRPVLRSTLRSRRPLPVFGAARAAASATRVLPLLVLTIATALAAFAVTLQTTTARGLSDGSWQTVGADVRIDVYDRPRVSAAETASGLAKAPGVRQVVAGRVADAARFTGNGTSVTARLVVVDAEAFRRLRASTPLPAMPGLARSGPAGGIPALVRTTDGSFPPGTPLQLLRTGAPPVALIATGVAPDVGNAGDVVLVDSAAATAAGLKGDPDTIWVSGPGAARAAASTPVDGQVIVRAHLLDERREAPLTSGLSALDRAAFGALLILALVGLALAAAASAPQRWETLARLRTLGLRPRDARLVAAGEMLPLVVVALFGPLLGLAFAWLCFGSYALRLLTAQTVDPAPVVPWWPLALMAVVLVAALPVVVAAEASVRRRRSLGETLRVGGA